MNKILLDAVNVADGIGDAVNVGAAVEVDVTFVAVGASVGFGDAVNARVGVRGGVTVEVGAGVGGRASNENQNEEREFREAHTAHYKTRDAISRVSRNVTIRILWV